MEKSESAIEVLKKENYAGVTVLGCFFIFLPFLFVFETVRTASMVYENAKLLQVLRAVFIKSPPVIIGTILAFCYLFFTGVGILRFKRWAYYSAFLAIELYFLGVMKFFFIFGAQFVNKYSTYVLLSAAIGITIFLMNKNVIARFNADYINKYGKRVCPKKVLFSSMCVFVAVFILLMAATILFSKRYALNVNVKPQKIKYQIDKTYILNYCQRRTIFDYSIYVPNNFGIISVSKGDSGRDLTLSLGESDSMQAGSFVILKSEGFLGLAPLARMLDFRTAYDLEKAINYPSGILDGFILLILRSVSLPLKNLVGIDDAVSGNEWKGIVRRYFNKERGQWQYDASLYSLRADRTCRVSIFFRDKSILAEQAKSMLSLVEFNGYDVDVTAMFEDGKAFLANGDFISAGINFMNVFYRNENNSEYAYYLSRVLFEDTKKAGRKGRLRSSREFLGCALKLNPEYREAKELLILVDNEIKQAEQAECKNP